GIAHVELVDRGLSGHPDLRSARRVYEVHLQQRRQRSLRYLQRQLPGHIADVERETKLMKVEIDHGLGRDRERFGFTSDAQRTAVDHHLEQRLHEDVHVRGQIGDEGDVEFEVFEPVLLVQHLVVEMYITLVNLNVRDREALRFGIHARRRRGGWAGSFEQVREIETLLGDPNDMYRGMFDCYFADHRRQPQERGPRNLDPDVTDIDEAIGRVAIADVQLFDIEQQPVRVGTDLFDADGAMEAGGQASGHDVLRNHRHADEAREAEKHEHDDYRDERPAHPAPAAETAATDCPRPDAPRASSEFVDH